MSAPLAAFPDVKVALVDLLTPLAQTGVEVPSGYTGVTPFLWINIIGGTDDLYTDKARFDIGALSNDEHAADVLAEQVRQLLIYGPHVTTAGLLDRVITMNRPHTQLYSAGPPKVYNTTAFYQASTRR